ncbi:NAD-dependent malic enzyme, partial [Pseudomonas fluorescens]
NALAECSPVVMGSGDALLPPLKESQKVSQKVALAVAKQAQVDGVALETTEEMLVQAIESHFWAPDYRSYRRRSI